MQRSNVFERYRNIDVAKQQCLKNKTSYFISNHESSATVVVNRTGESIVGTLVLNDADGPDSAYLFVHKDADIMIGDYFTWLTTTFFIYEEAKVVKDVDYIKYKILECNVFVNDSFWAYFKSTMTATKDTSLGGVAEKSSVVPLLVAPKNEMLSIGGRVNFNNQDWDIEDGDIFTLTGIGYYYLTRGVNSRDEEPQDEYENEISYYVGSTIVSPTENGYYKAVNADGEDFKIKLIKRNISSITFSPMESGELQLTIIANGQSVTNVYTIKENV